MGAFSIPIEVVDISGTRFVQTEAMVDTGAVFTMLPEDMIAGFTLIAQENQRFRLADGSPVEYPVGYLRLRFEQKDVIAPVIVAPEGVMPLLGATALENALLGVDPHNERLIPIEGSLRPAYQEATAPPLRGRHTWTSNATMNTWRY